MKTFIPKYKDYFEKMNDNKLKSDEEDIFYTEVDINDFVFDKSNGVFTYPCPCGDNFEFFLEDLLNYEETAKCPSCSLIVKVVYGEEDVNFYSSL